MVILCKSCGSSWDDDYSPGHCTCSSLAQQNRRMMWVLNSVIAPDGEHTLWDRYSELDDEFWSRHGL